MTDEERNYGLAGRYQAELDALRAQLAARDEENAKFREALTKISAIRDSIVGMQGFNFSEHAYPLVAALDEAGFKGAGYEISRANLGTIIEQIAARDRQIAELRKALWPLVSQPSWAIVGSERAQGYAVYAATAPDGRKEKP